MPLPRIRPALPLRAACLAVFVLCWLAIAQAAQRPTLLFVAEADLQRTKAALAAADPALAPALGQLREECAEAMAVGVLTVTDKKLASPSADPRDYVSRAPYWWPDPDKADGSEAEPSADGEEKEAEDPLDRMIEDAGIEKIAFVLWSDTEALADPATKASKAIVSFTVKDAVDAYGMPVALEIPITTAWREIAGGRRIGLELEYAPYEGENTSFTMDARLRTPIAGTPTVSNVTATMEVNSEEDGEAFTARLFGEEITDAQGVKDTSVSVKGASNGQSYALGYAYDGVVSTEAE